MQQPYADTSREQIKYRLFNGKIIVIEGGIAFGKTTLMNSMQKYLESLNLDVVIYPEPIMDKYLQMFLRDQKKHAFGFQIAMLMKRKEIYRKAMQDASLGKVVIIDRSMYGDYCFAQLHKEAGNIDKEIEWDAYISEFKDDADLKHPDYVVYLQVDAEIALERCSKRDRKGEKSAYDLDYFSNLRKAYDTIIDMSPSYCTIKLDWNTDRSGEDPIVGSKYILDTLFSAHYKSFM